MSKNPDKKKREREKLLQRRRQRQARKAAEEVFPQSAKLLPPDTKIVRSIPGMPKMSDQLTAFVEPYSEVIETDEAIRKLLTVGMVAWNAALKPPAKRPEMLGAFLHTFGGAGTQLAAEFLQIVGALIQRKETDPRFANDRRRMIDFVLTETPSGPHLQVLSALPGGEAR
jgi:hypothetical protein